MIERPILFSAPMVRAILDGTKTQTRRIMKIQPPSASYKLATLCDSTGREDRNKIGKHHWTLVDGVQVVDGTQPYFSCPYGYIDDRLWVRETWHPKTWPSTHPVPFIYRADDGMDDLHKHSCPGFKWRPSIHMPRAASRIDSEITGLRAERLQDISEADAIAEGIKRSCRAVSSTYAAPCFWDYLRNEPQYTDARNSYASLWESINGHGSWDANPWVWAIEFKRLTAQEVAK